MKNKKGISLIVLIVTIIVIIILAAAVILTLSKNNPIESAREATFKEDVRAFQDELALSVSKEYVEKQGQRDQKITTNKFDEIKKYIPSFTKKYDGKFVIENDKLIGTDELTEKEVKWSQDLSVVASNKAPVDTQDWDKTATNEDCFIWNGNTIIGYNEEKLAGITNLRIPSKCTAIELEYTYQPDGIRELVSQIESVEIPGTCVTLGKGAFCTFTSLKDVTISEGVTSIGDYAFNDCSSLTSITIPEGVTSIGSSAFEECSNLTSITIPNSVTSIENSAFWGCSSLTSITIPEGITSIGDNTFRSCSNLTNITIPSTVTSIGVEAFYQCSSLVSITLPNGLINIGENVFWECKNLTNITLPEGVTSIPSSAFWGCSSLASITISDSVTSIGALAFYNTAYYNNSDNWENKVLYINNHLIDAKENISGEYIIKLGTKSLAPSAFKGCSNLTSITIPDTVTEIGSFAFYGCTKLTSITIPNTVTSIEDSSFGNCTSLTSITIPNSVTYIKGYIFNGSTKIKNINFEGIMSEWNNISKNEYWKYNSYVTTITCTDGTINL